MIRTVIVVAADGTAREYSLHDAPTILDAFENAGFYYPHGCRIGCCGACISEVIENEDILPPADSRENQRLVEFEEQARFAGNPSIAHLNLRLMCRTPLTGNITIRPLSGKIRKQQSQ